MTGGATCLTTRRHTRGFAFLSQTARRQYDMWDRGLQRPGLGTGYRQGSDLQGQAVSGLRAGEDRLPGAHRSWPSTALHPARKFNSSHICVPRMWRMQLMGGTMFTPHCGSVPALRIPQSKTQIGSDSSKFPNSLLEQGPPQFKGM